MTYTATLPQIWIFLPRRRAGRIEHYILCMKSYIYILHTTAAMIRDTNNADDKRSSARLSKMLANHCLILL